MLIPAVCDLCGGTDFAPVYPATLDPEADPACDFSTHRRRAAHCAIVRCRSCGLLLSHPRDDPGTLQDVYARLSDDRYDAEENNRVWTARRRARRLSRQLPAGSLLDVGCSTGIFMSEAAQLGWRVTGIDPSACAIHQAKTRVPHANFVTGGVETAAFQPCLFDVITLWDVLEHVSSPALVLSQARSWLKPGGWLIMNVPNAGSIPARVMGRRWVLLLREHLWYFSPVTVKKYCENNHFQVKSIEPNWVKFSLGGIAARLRQYPGFGTFLGKGLARFERLAALSLQFPMGEMTVWAQADE